MTTYDLIVRVTLPEGYTLREVREYVEDAVRGWSGQYDPTDPMFWESKRYRVLKRPLKFTNEELALTKSALRRMLKKEQKELERSTFVPEPGKRHAQEAHIDALNRVMEKLTNTTVYPSQTP